MSAENFAVTGAPDGPVAAPGRPDEDEKGRAATGTTETDGGNGASPWTAPSLSPLTDRDADAGAARDEEARRQQARAATARAPVRPPEPGAEPRRPRPVRDLPGEPRKPSRAERKSMGRLRARKVRRVLRHVDPWSVFKLSLLFYLCLFITVMVAGVLLWHLAAAAGTLEDVEGFVKDMGAFETFQFEGDQIFRATLFGGLIMVLFASGVNVLMAILFNLISDLVGGVRVTVIEEETAHRVLPEKARRAT